jgi:hypothetical protein
MAIRYAIASGDWSNPAIWDGGVSIPTAGDEVYTNSYRVVVDQDIDVSFLSSRSLVSPALLASGSFIASGSGRIISASIFGGNGVAAVANYTLQDTGSMNWVVVGDVYASQTNNLYTLVQNTTGSNLTIYGNISASVVVSAKNVFTNGVLTVNGNLNQVNFSNGANRNIEGANTSNIIVNGNLLQNSLNSSANLIFTSGDLTVNGDITLNTGPTAIIINSAGAPKTFNYNGNIIFNSDGSPFSNVNVLSTNNINTSITTNAAIASFVIGNGTWNWTGNLEAGNRGHNAGLLQVGGTNTIFNFTGNIRGGSILNARGLGIGGINVSASIIGNIFGGNSSATSPGNLQLWSYGLINNATTSSFITGDIVAICDSTLNIDPAIYNLNTNNLYIQRAICSSTSFATPVWGRVRFKNTNPEFIVSKQDNTMITLSDPALQDYPSINDVRDGVEYGFLSYEGNLIVPPSGNVSLNYNYDSNGSVTGSAILTPQNLFTAISSSSDPVAERLRNVSTVGTTGDQIVAFFP